MEYAVLLALVLVNGLFAMAELAIFASQRGRLQQRAGAGSAGAAVVLRILEHPTPYLSTVQVGITLIGVVAGAFGEKALAADLAQSLARWPLLASHADALALVAVVGCITVVSLVLGELVPKRLALLQPEAIACAVALPLRGLSVATRPVVSALGFLTEGVLWLFRARAGRVEQVTEDDVRTALREAAAGGALADEELDIADRALALGDLRVADAAIPRHEVDWVDLDGTLEEALEVVKGSRHSRFPAGRGTLDQAEGVINARELLCEAMTPTPRTLEGMLLPVRAVPESASLLSLLRTLSKGGGPLTLVVDEHGQTAGIVTPSDLVARLVTGLTSALGTPEPSMVRRADGSWLVDGDATLQSIGEALGCPALARYRSPSVRTIAGLLLRELGRLGRTGDVVEWEGARLEIVDTDGRRIDRVLVTLRPDDTEVTVDSGATRRGY